MCYYAMQFCTMYVCYVNTKLLTKILLYKHTLRCFANVFQKKLIYKGRVTRIHISEILYSVIFPKYYSCVSLIISNCFKMLRNQDSELKIPLK